MSSLFGNLPTPSKGGEVTNVQKTTTPVKESSTQDEKQDLSTVLPISSVVEEQQQTKTIGTPSTSIHHSIQAFNFSFFNVLCAIVCETK